MGTSKALLSPRGITFLERVTRALVDGGCDPVFAVVRDLDGAEASLALRLGIRVELNSDPSEGPISSLRTAIGSLDSTIDGLAWCPVDYPLVRAETVARLCIAFQAHPDAVVVPSQQDKRGHPVIFPRRLFSALCEDGLSEGARSVVRSPGVEVVAVPVTDPGVLADIDTRADLLREFPSFDVENAS